MLFKEAYENYEKYISLKLKVQSIRSIKNRFKVQILPYFENYDIYELNENDYLNWQYEIESKNYGIKYKQTIHIAIVTFLNYCITYYNLEKNIAQRVGNFKNKDISKKQYNFFTLEEFNLFIKYVDNNIYKQLFNLMFYTGVRPGEAIALKFSDLNDNYISINKTIDERYYNNKRTINSPKSYSSIRDILIDNKLKEDLLQLKLYYQIQYGHNNDYFIFGGLKPLSPTTITRIKNKACEWANLKQIRLHDFRHSHATLLVSHNLMINEISRRLGHSNVAITLNTYVHTNKEQEKRVVETLNFLRLN